MTPRLMMQLGNSHEALSFGYDLWADLAANRDGVVLNLHSLPFGSPTVHPNLVCYVVERSDLHHLGAAALASLHIRCAAVFLVQE